ncbi:MAG: sulfatase-like hydrolase/transferase, partial [Planctomycetota bacterium]
MRTLLALLLCTFTLTPAVAQDSATQPPNILLMMADDLVFSDIGCYGSEIPTPHLDRLAAQGLRFSDFTNTSRCCPSRASLLTGMYSHQVGIGDMNYKGNTPAYAGQISATTPLIPELLREAGYSTAMVGKWHLTQSPTITKGPNGSWPFQRGFDKFFGSMEGAKNYFAPTWLFDQDREIRSFEEGFYYTNAISERAVKWIREQPANKPLFLYTAFYTPHFPLQAPEEAIAKYRGKYMSGWDKLREARLAKQKSLGMHQVEINPSPRPDDMPAWEKLSGEQQEALDIRMATYAAQVEMLDHGVGRLLDALEESGRSNNTLILFLSDNGAASSGGVLGAGPIEKVGGPNAPVKTTYGKGWATLSNTPYRMHKANTHEGGIKAPLIVVPPSLAAPSKDSSNS